VSGTLRETLGSDFVLPSPATGYRNSLGRFDYSGAVLPQGENQYSERVITIDQNHPLGVCQNPNDSVNWTQIKDAVLGIGGNLLQNGIYHIGQEDIPCNLIIDEAIFFGNGLDSSENGSGLFIIEGDLIVNDDITYIASPIDVVTQLASVGWIVKGSVTIDSGVTQMVGAYTVIGCDSGVVANCQGAPLLHDGTFDTGSGGNQLEVRGLVLAKRIILDRNFADPVVGSEVIFNDGRLHANPPPALVDISRTIPLISSVRP
ncbi:MAG: hypothetical protein Q8Q20_03945, partial [bacterium]|nr:hypothetical protein [bacterium]